MSFDTNEFYIKSAEEMAESFAEWPEAVPTTLEIAERCNVEIELGKLLLPRYPTADGEEPEEMLRRIAAEGLRARYGDPPPAEAVERLEFELGVIEEMGFSSYFLIVWDFVRYAKENGDRRRPGPRLGGRLDRLLQPQHHRPRPARQRPAVRALPQPGAQIDAGHRHRLLGPRPRADDPLRRREVRPRVGRPDHHLRQDGAARRDPRRRPRARLRLRHRRPAGEADPGADHGPQPLLRGVPEGGPGAEQTYDAEPDAKKIIDVAQGLEGIIRNNSIHAAAVVIADRPLQEIVPLQLAEDRSAPAAGNGNGNRQAERQYKIVTQYSMGPIEEIGLLKMDFLGLRNLDVIEDAIDIIERSRGERIDMEEIPIDDAKTYAMLARGDSTGVFQFESEGMREALRKVGPTEFADLVALGALYRPGAMAYIPAYAKGKRDPSSVRYPDPRLRPITEETYGCVLYQEQLMEIAADGRLHPAPRRTTCARRSARRSAS